MRASGDRFHPIIRAGEMRSRLIIRIMALAVIFLGYAGMPKLAVAQKTPGECTSGGPGATSCSQGLGGVSCSVSCQGQSYACCKTGTPPECTCVVWGNS